MQRGKGGSFIKTTSGKTKMKYIFLIFLLTACTKTDAPITNSIIEGAKSTLESIKKTLPEECRTETINAQIVALETQINNVPEICQAEIEPIKAERDEYQLKFNIATMVLIGLFVLLFRRK